MTTCTDASPAFDDEALRRPSVRSPTRRAHQAKAQPSLRAGADGVGGLVAVSIGGSFYFPGYDNNGNVIGYWDETGSLVAEYAYDAFGNTIASSGTMADVFPHRFSTKYYDAETDLYYYGYRYYSPSLGRWISRDPIEEHGGRNLLTFCRNNAFIYVDAFGRNPNDPELFFIPDTAEGIPWGKKVLPDDVSGQTEPFYKVKCCVVKVGVDVKNANKPLYGMKCIVYVVQQVYLNSKETRWTPTGSYGHEQRHVEAFISDVRSSLKKEFKNIMTQTNAVRSSISNQISKEEESLRNLIHSASQRGSRHEKPHPESGIEYPVIGTMPPDPISDDKQPSLPDEIKCDECP